MLTRIALGATGSMANSDHLMGALAITVAVIATAEVARALRFVNLLLGGWVILSPFILHAEGLAGTIVRILAGLALIGLSIPRGRRSAEHYDGWDRFIF